jgi:hypothetical protein
MVIVVEHAPAPIHSLDTTMRNIYGIYNGDAIIVVD